MAKEQYEESEIRVKMFGSFSVIYNGEELVDSRQTGSQFCALMETILHYHASGVDRALLKEMLFEDREVDDIQHAIRNVIYNAKKRLKAAGMPGDSFIEVRKGIYYWTAEVPIRLDTEEMEKHYDMAVQEEDPERKLEYFLEAVHCYQGAFLEQLSNAVWVVHEARRYRKIFQDAVNQAADLLRQSRRFKELKELGEYAVQTDPFEDWEVLIVEALSALGRYDEAERFCEKTIDLYIEEHGQRNSTYVRALSNRLSSSLIHRHESLDEIQEKLVEEESVNRGGFYCSYPAFQEVYRILARTMDRQRDRIFIMLCTVIDSKGNPMREGSKLEELSERLADAIVRSVRHSDTVTRYGKGQYLVLLVNTTKDNCVVVQKRVDRNFLEGRQRTGIEYSVRSVIISPEDIGI